MNQKELIVSGKTSLGIELGSTRIKSVLIDDHGSTLAVGVHDWENRYIDHVWTYTQQDVMEGIQACYKDLKKQVRDQYGITLHKVESIGISGMMHGYIALDEKGEWLAPFETWRNTNTQEAASELSELFEFNIPLRWSVSHLYQKLLVGKEHVLKIKHLKTLGAYVHYVLSGSHTIGIGDASGMFPTDPNTLDYDACMIEKMDHILQDHGAGYCMKDILPRIVKVGEVAGTLSKEGALLLDPDGDLESGIIMAPSEGDAETGMVATNSVKKATGNISCGTSIFAMIVLKDKLKKWYREIDVVATPLGDHVAMSHASNGTSDFNAWVNLFKEFKELAKIDMSTNEIYELLLKNSLNGNENCGSCMTYGYLSSEDIVGVSGGCPLVLRKPGMPFTLADFIRSQIYSSFAAVTVGIDLLKDNEGVEVDEMYAHGGIFKTEGVAQLYLANALGFPVTVMQTASEGGAWGMALLARYLVVKDRYESFVDYLEQVIFKDLDKKTVVPTKSGIDGFKTYLDQYKKGLDVEREAVKYLEK